MYLIIAICGVTGISIFVIKLLADKNKHLKFKLDFVERQIKQIEENSKNYRKIITELNDKGKQSEEVKKKIDYATGGFLAELANSL